MHWPLERVTGSEEVVRGFEYALIILEIRILVVGVVLIHSLTSIARRRIDLCSNTILKSVNLP